MERGCDVFVLFWLVCVVMPIRIRSPWGNSSEELLVSKWDGLEMVAVGESNQPFSVFEDSGYLVSESLCFHLTDPTELWCRTVSQLVYNSYLEKQLSYHTSLLSEDCLDWCLIYLCTFSTILCCLTTMPLKLCIRFLSCLTVLSWVAKWWSVIYDLQALTYFSGEVNSVLFTSGWCH